MVKRVGNLFDKMVSIENLTDAYKNARKGKSHHKDVIAFEENIEDNLLALQKMLIDGAYHTSEYRIFTIHERGKDREVADLPFYPDRIVHRALMNVIKEPIVKNLIPQTYAALPGKGTHQAHEQLKKYLRNKDATHYLKIDIKKYFASIDRNILFGMLERRIKDRRVLDLCRRILDEYPLSGIPIGNYTSQYFANFYLSEIDHFMKECYHCRYYIRYMDDIIILGWSKRWLHRAYRKLSVLTEKIHLTIKGNWCIRPVTEGIDYVGFVTYPTHSLLRKKIKTAVKKAVKTALSHSPLTSHDRGSINSYHGYSQWCDCKHLFDVIGLTSLYDGMHRTEDEIIIDYISSYLNNTKLVFSV